LFPQGAGAVFCFGIDGSRSAGATFINALQLSSNLANVGDCRTLVLHPARTTHSRLDDASMIAAGIGPDLLRVSVGIEAIGDIKADFTRGLKAARKVAKPSQ
jgi:O-acetylhomoserine (thiol)-lyase